ncbi:MAG: Gfo/Idh/MocA family oxidoreductase [Planctomycetota bacterium]|nr:Gfo/Idh/MocA family oxidoreductase [Planctomycetota bacterium]
MSMIRLAIAGTGGMAVAHYMGYSAQKGVKVTACCDVIEKTARNFAERFNIPAVYTDFNQMIAAEPLDAVAISASDAAHAPLALAAIKKGLHVMCEKPLATNAADAKKMAAAAKKSGVINMVNFSYRRSSALQKARHLVLAGKLGKVIHVEASYLQSWLPSTVWGDWRKSKAWLWRLSKAAGSGGVLGDVGCHIIDFATFAAGDIENLCCRLKTFEKGVKGNIYKGYTLDANDSATINVMFKNGAMGVIDTTRWATGHANSLYLKIYGTKGGLEIDLDAAYDKLRVCLGNDIHKTKWKTISCGKGKDNYRRFIESIKTGINDSPTFAEGAKVQQYLDSCFISDEQKMVVKV